MFSGGVAVFQINDKQKNLSHSAREKAKPDFYIIDLFQKRSKYLYNTSREELKAKIDFRNSDNYVSFGFSDEFLEGLFPGFLKDRKEMFDEGFDFGDYKEDREDETQPT